MWNYIISSALLCGVLFASPEAIALDRVPLQTGPHRDVEITALPGGVSEISVSGAGPHFWTAPVPPTFDPGKHTVIAFEYFSPSGVESISVRYRQTDGTMTLRGSSEIPLAETWQPFSIDLSEGTPKPPAGDPQMRFHFAMSKRPGTSLQIRRFEIREPNPAEIAAKSQREAVQARREADAEAYLKYLRKEYPDTVSNVTVGLETIRVQGNVSGSAILRELPPQHASHRPLDQMPLASDLSGEFDLSFPRFSEGNGRDSALSRWRLDGKDGGIRSRCRWPDQTEEGIAADLPKLQAPHQKGLGGIPAIGDQGHEIFELGISHATVNFVITSLISAVKKPGFEPFLFEGKNWFYNARYLAQTRTTVEHLVEREIIVSCILLVANQAGRPMTHPDAEPRGIYSIPNLATPEGANHYRAALYLLADRFSKPEARISNWIIHNEIDQAGVWTNMGDQPLARYLETYMRSARLVYHTMRLRDPNSRVFISLTHHWSKTSSGQGTYQVREMLDLFNEMGRAEGDFEWGVAYHPYPQDLRNPDTWNDADVTGDFETPYITPKNLEVLPAYLAQERFLYRGKTARTILFSEQGFNTPTLSIEDQKRQVAGLIYTFRKLRTMPTVEAYHLHRYQDMPEQEGGLRLGIIDENGNRKLGWDAYVAIGTEREKEFDAITDELSAPKAPESAPPQ
jgi:hypothetical protein